MIHNGLSQSKCPHLSSYLQKQCKLAASLHFSALLMQEPHYQTRSLPDTHVIMHRHKSHSTPERLTTSEEDRVLKYTKCNPYHNRRNDGLFSPQFIPGEKRSPHSFSIPYFERAYKSSQTSKWKTFPTALGT